MASQTIAGLELQYTQDNKRCYAYSGIRASAPDPDDAIFLDFTTGSGFIVADLQCFNHATNGAGNNLQYQIFLNGIMIIAQTNFDQNNPYNRLRMVIPPSTRFVVKVDNLSGSADTASVSLTGKVYEYLPVRN